LVEGASVNGSIKCCYKACMKSKSIVRELT